MILDMFYEENTKVVVSYLPVWEFFFSLHVLAKPEHHVTRKKWVRAKEETVPDIVKEIRELKEITNSWILIIDSVKWKEIRQMEIVEMLAYFQRKNIYQWNQWIKDSAGNEMSKNDRDRVLLVMKQYYDLVFRKEEIILRTYLMRVLQDEKEKCKKEGIWNWIGTIHSRLKVEPEEVVYMKNREFRYKKAEIRTVWMTVSTFVHPHLWLYKHAQELEVVKGVGVEQTEEDIPEDFVQLLKALGDKNRLRIIKLLMKEVATTQELAQRLQISEAAVSKHLKILNEANLVRKTKNGFYMEYRFDEEMIHYIPYRFYEIMMM